MPDILEPLAAKRVKLVGFDVDGILTDNAVYVGSVDGRRVEFKRFDIADGIGLKLLRAAGVTVTLLSGRASQATTFRAEELGIDEVIQDDGARKLAPFDAMLARHGVRWEDAAFMGDDLPDLPVMRRVGLPVTVPAAAPEVRDVAHYVTRATGGAGAAREFIEVLLRARGDWDGLVQDYLAQRGDHAARRSAVHHAP
jgi:3-deoxy-D-manno-octulosonate 8-phosphate phosphatase (KDO 8-P phosphatase)